MPKGYNMYLDSDGKTKAILYKTKIVEFSPDDNTIILNNGGWQSNHTKKCINLALANTPYRLFQEKFNWFIGATIDGQYFKIPYTNNMRLILRWNS